MQIKSQLGKKIILTEGAINTIAELTEDRNTIARLEAACMRAHMLLSMVRNDQCPDDTLVDRSLAELQELYWQFGQFSNAFADINPDAL
ncbi:MAG: hypothetical protein Q4F57_02445 [Weeksellaceae bacterium]|nr:hypothetical protein [Weeksellaceae bacterium]